MKHLTIEERETIFFLRSSGKSLTAIGKVINKNKSVISRELRRNKHPKKNHYSPNVAQKLYEIRRANIKKKRRLKSALIRQYVIEGLEQDWSPEQISGRLKIDHPEYPTISYEAIYQFIYEPIILRIFNLPQYLRRRHKKRFKKGLGRSSKRVLIPSRIPIEQRPREVEERLSAGDWEGDSIVSRKSSAALNTIVERKTGYGLISLLDRKTAENTKDAVITRLSNFPEELRKTLTLDNGCENTRHKEITQTIGIECYFANPYHSWERGTNENFNGLVRQYFPKGTDFSTVSQEEITRVEYLLNTRPRKRLGFKTPLEGLEQELNKAA